LLTHSPSHVSNNACRGPEGDEMVLLVKGEIEQAKSTMAELETKIVLALTPRDNADERGVVLEVRPGTGSYFCFRTLD
jgi:protein subunit release factor A